MVNSKGQHTNSQEAVWFRRLIEVPNSLHGYDLTGARIWFSFAAYANGPMPEIFYFNGRRVAFGDDLEPIVLFDKAKPSDKILVAVMLLHTVWCDRCQSSRTSWRSRKAILSLLNDTVTAPIHPFEILTVRVDYSKQ